MTMKEQYEHLTDVLMTAFDAAIDEIPGEEVDGMAVGGAIAYLLDCVAKASNDPTGFLREFCVRLLHAHALQVAEQGEEDRHG